MKKNLFIAIITVLAGLVSCMEDEVEKSKPETFTFSIQTEVKTKTRTAAPVVEGKDARYIIELWNNDKSSRIERIIQLNNPEFSLTLDKSLSYYVAVWVDYVTDVDDESGTPADYFYVTDNLKRVVLNSLDGDPDAFDGRAYQMSNLPARDAFTGVFAFTSGQTYPASLTVKRPLAKINLLATDAGLWKDRPEVNGATLTFRITNPGYYTYNVLTQSCGETGLNIEFKNTVDSATYNHYPADVAQTVLSGLYFANANTMDNGGDTQSFVLHWKIGNGSELGTPISNLPFKRNFNTNITGGTLFDTVTFDIDASTEYDDPDIEDDF